MIITPLMPHQHKALDYLKWHDPCALFMFLGSGKSLVALAYAEHVGAKRILITSDKNNILNTWPEQVWTHTDYVCMVRPNPLNLINASTLPVDEGVYSSICVCVNYDLLPSREEEYKRVKWDMWIGDESSLFKDQRSDRYKALRRVVKDIPHKIILNGEPMTERMQDLYGQLSLIDTEHKIGATFSQFSQRYLQLEPRGYGWVPKRSALTQLQRDARDFTYWLPHDPAIKLPERRYHVVRCDMHPDVVELDKELEMYFSASMGEEKIEVEYATSLLIKRIQLTGGVFHSNKKEGEKEPEPLIVSCNKLGVVKKLVYDNLDSKIVIWHQYIRETKLLLRELDTLDGPIHIHTPEYSNLNKFQQAKRGILLIRNSMCRGLNQLADADIACFYSLPLSYQIRAQAEGRTRRISSGSDVTHVVDIVTKGGVDERIYHMLSQKKNFALTLNTLRGMVDAGLNERR